MTYRGSCHCGAVRFTLTSDPITSGRRCNCSMCTRKGAVMSVRYYPPEEITVEAEPDALAVYLWGDRMVNHYFCKRCGIYPFHDSTEKPGHYRVNLGCVEGIDPLALAIELLDGRSLPVG